jgi:GNAT superfamily N-acetyltransferase
MVEIKKIDTTNKREVRQFSHFPLSLYKGVPQWVPPILIDVEATLDKGKHPFFEHSDGDFFIALEDGKIVGRIAALENKPYNQYKNRNTAQFFFFETVNNLEVAEALFSEVQNWATARNLTEILGPKGFGPVDGYGMLVEGFEHRQTMTMVSYNFPYYPTFMEMIGFEKEMDFVSCYTHWNTFTMPERVQRIARKVKARGKLKVHEFTSKRELVAWAPRIGKTYNESFVENWEYYPLTEREINFVLDNLMQIADPRLIKVITADDQVVGFTFAFPDISEGLQRSGGHLLPIGIIHILRDVRKTRWLAVNGAGILPEYQGRGGNALLYYEMYRTLKDYHYEHLDLVQVAETATQMRADLENVGVKPYKNHRVYVKSIESV